VMRYKLFWLKAVAASVAGVVVLTGLAVIAPAWAVLLLATGGIAACIWFLLLFGPAEPLHGQRGE